jgi:hypothetical protein
LALAGDIQEYVFCCRSVFTFHTPFPACLIFIKVMACKKMLVLCGDTYSHRLWCVWKLFTLAAFTSEAQTVAKVEVVPLLRSETQTSTDIFSQLKDFSLSRAKCFDPNEERRLRGIIKARGVEHFESRIRNIACQCEESFSKAQRGRSHTFASSLLAFRNKNRSDSTQKQTTAAAAAAAAQSKSPSSASSSSTAPMRLKSDSRSPQLSGSSQQEAASGVDPPW